MLDGDLLLSVHVRACICVLLLRRARIGDACMHEGMNEACRCQSLLMLLLRQRARAAQGAGADWPGMGRQAADRGAEGAAADQQGSGWQWRQRHVTTAAPWLCCARAWVLFVARCVALLNALAWLPVVAAKGGETRDIPRRLPVASNCVPVFSATDCFSAAIQHGSWAMCSWE